ncbi:MAG: AraC family transcriptional regulator [Gemmatimonadaceae bacterium]
MDALAVLLDGPRARGAFLLRSLWTPPWSVHVQDRAPLTLVAIVRGDVCLIRASARNTSKVSRLKSGDVAIIRGTAPYTVADSPTTAIQAVIHSGQRCTTPDGRDLAHATELGLRTWGNSSNGSTEMLVGTYRMHGDISRRLLEVLPNVVVLRDASDIPFVALLVSEMGKNEPGQDVVLDRLLDVLLVAVLRKWFSRPDAKAPGWYRALADPVVGRALRIMHKHPADPWTVATLAAAVGASRALLARRFTEQVGEPPMTYLTGWRLALAGDLLREPDATIGSVAEKVGYSSAFALSAAFKRAYGVSPQQHRDRNPEGEPPA